MREESPNKPVAMNLLTHAIAKQGKKDKKSKMQYLMILREIKNLIFASGNETETILIEHKKGEKQDIKDKAMKGGVSSVGKK